MTIKEILVTGAAGFIGGHTVRACRDQGWRVTALDIRPPGPGLPRDDATTLLQAPMDDPRVHADLRAGRYAAVLHQAAISDTLEDDWERLEHHNVTGALALAEASAQGGATFVYASSHSVYGTISDRAAVSEGDEYDPSVCTGPLNAYARSKLLLDERMAGAFGSRPGWVALRYTNVFGPGEEPKGRMASIISQLLRTAATGGVPDVFADTLAASRDYVPVEAVTAVLVALVGTPVPSGVYNLGSGAAVSFAEVLEWCARFGGGEPLTVRLVANPVPERYQYWTRADQGRLRAALPRLPVCGPEAVRRAAEALYLSFARDRLPV